MKVDTTFVCLLAILIILNIMGCRQENDFKKRITGGRHRYWDLHRHEDGKIGSYRFDKDGSCYYLIYGAHGKRTLFYADDEEGILNRWRIFKDSIDLGGSEVYKYSLMNDSILLKKKIELTINGKPEMLLIVDTFVLSIDQTDAYNFDSLKKCKNTKYYYERD